MGKGIFYPTANTDDGIRYASAYSGTSANFVAWGTSSYLGSFMRFRNVTVPAGATITSAKLQLYGDATVVAGTGSCDIYCVDDANPGVPADATEYDALALTTAKTNWPAAAVTVNAWQDSPSFASAVQEVIDLPGWASGNSLAVVVKDIDLSNAKTFQEYSHNVGRERLVLEWTVSGRTTASYYPTAGTDDGFGTPPSSFDNTAAYVLLGNTGLERWAFVRFRNVGLNPGSIVHRAIVRFKATNLQANQVYLDVDAVASATPAVPTSYSELEALTLTGSPVRWIVGPEGSWTAGQVYDSVDITSLIQASVDRSGWAKGNNILLSFKYVSGGGVNDRYGDSYEGTTKPELIVEFTQGVIDAGFTDAAGLGDTVDGVDYAGRITDAAGLGDTVDALDYTGRITDAAGLGDAVDATDPNVAFADAVGLGDSVDAPDPNSGFADAAGLGDSIGRNAEKAAGFTDGAGLSEVIDAVRLAEAIAEAMEVHDYSDRSIETASGSSDGSAMGDAVEGFNFTAWLRANRNRISYRYECTLTGSADGKEDVALPISSIQARMRTASPSFAAVVIPGVSYSDAITDRPNGEIVLEMVAYLDGVEALREEILRVDLDAVRLDEGTGSKSITIEGHRTVTYSERDTDLQFVTYRRFSDGKYAIRCAVPDWYLRPGHVARYDGASFTVDNLSFYIMVTDQYFQANMEVNE